MKRNDQLRITLRRHRAGLATLGIGVAALALFAVLAMGGPSRGLAADPADPADLSLSKSDSPDPVVEGAALTYTILVSNAGPDPATNVVVTDDLPKQIDFVSATTTSGTCQTPSGKGKGKSKGGKVECNLGTLSNGGTATVTITTTASKSGDISNTASVTSDVTDPHTANNSDTEPTKVLAAAKASTCANKKATIVGTPGDDLLIGTSGSDVILALAGNDTVFARDGKDLVCAQAGADIVNGGARPDLIRAGSGPDLVKGRGGGDELRGQRGRDLLRGNRGPDLLAGGRGFDRCRGGAGQDTLRSCEG
jgi:uncharacterized repeat protein (TIGR01451 family)